MPSPKPTPKPTQVSLEFPSTAVMRWEDLPPAIRDRVRAHLAALLGHAAGRAATAQERPDDA